MLLYVAYLHKVVMWRSNREKRYACSDPGQGPAVPAAGRILKHWLYFINARLKHQ